MTLAALALVAGPGHSLGSPAGDPTAHPRPAPAARREEVRLWVARDVAPGPRVRVTINTRNLAVVHLAAYRLDGVAWLLRRAPQQGRPSEPPEKGLTPTWPAGRPVREWDTTVATRHERPGPAQRDVFRSRQANLPPLPPGVYLLTARGGASEARAIVNITELAVVVKRAPRKALVWVCSYDTGAPLPGARVSLYGARSRRLAAGMTRADGTCLLPAPPGSNQTVIVERNWQAGEERFGAQRQRRGPVPGVAHDLAAVPSPIEDPDGVLKLHFQTDRPVYRPGQTVFFKAILRRTAGQGYSPLVHTGCQVEVRDARDNPLQTERLTTNPVGTLAGRVELPAEGAPGPYTVAITAGKKTVYGSFTVAEYRKPEFKVTVRPAQRRYLAGEPAAFEVEAAYYFGGPLPQAEVIYQIRRHDSPYAEGEGAERWYAGGDGNLYPRDTYASHPFIAEGTVHTNDAGRVTIPFKTERSAPDSTYEIQCTVRDASRRVVEATTGVPVYAALLRLGLRTELLLAPLGTVIPLAVRAADLDGRPAAAAVTLSLRQPVWVEKEGRYRYRALAETRVSVPAAGSAAATVPAAAQGELQVVAAARDSTGRTASAILSLWVVGPSAKPARETREPQLSVRLDRRTYRPGDTARAWVSSNTRGRPILVTAEGADVWEYRVVPNGGTFLWPMKTRRSMSPNASVSACQWVRGNLLLDETVLPLPDPSQQLSVRIEPDQARYRPGDPARYLIRTRDGRGRPVSAEVAIAVVDEAIFAVRPDTTPDLFTAFWGRRPNLTRTTFSAPEELSGGAYQRTQAPAPVREQFLDTAYWAPRVTTAADGTARVSFAFPGNLTAWRATARAVTAETRVGAATAQVEVSRPVMLRLAVPRQVVQGDRLILAGTVHNRTEQEREFEAKLAAEGVRVEGEPVRRVRVPAGAEGKVEWTLSVDALPADGAARLQGEVAAVDAPPDRRAEFADALRVGLRIAPRGIAERIAVGGALARERSLDLTLPADRIEPATSVTITVRAGLREAVQDGARRVLAAGRHGSLGAADHLLVSIAADRPDPRVRRDALALLSRFQQGSGAWGWWETDPPDPVITARVLTSLAAARAAGVPVPETLLERGTAGAVGLYIQTNLWEYRALLAAAITLAGPREDGDARRPALGARGQQLLEEVQRRGTHLSPYARCLLAQALLQSGGRQAASAIAEEIARSAAIGPEVAYLPAGERPGWSATAAETTAQGLILLTRLSQEPELQRKLAEWLARPEEERSQDEEALATYALWVYSRMHPDPIQRGEVEVSVNGVPLEAPRPSEDQPLHVEVPRSVLQDGANRVALRRAGEGEVFVLVEARCFRPAHGEADAGIRVLRRLEARNGLGIWEEVRAPLPPAVILRATVLVWPRDGADAIRVTEPIPAGAELIDSEAEACAREEVRDGAVVHYLRGAGQPVSFRYYLRPESGGSVIALPAVAEAVRRPAVRGTSAAAGLEVEP